jgi:GTP cyclohydrolase II
MLQVQRTTTARIPTAEGTFQLCHYQNTLDDKEHLALVMGQVQGQRGILVRVHSECFTGDVLGSQRCDCGEQLHEAMRLIAQEGQGILIYLRQEGRGIGLQAKLKAYNLQDQGYDTVDANLMLGHPADGREYSAAAAILQDLEVASIRLMTNNPAKMDDLALLGISIDERQPLVSTVTPDNAAYLTTKIQRMRHLLTLPQNLDPAQTTPLPVIEVTSVEPVAMLRHKARAHHALTGEPFITLSYAQTLDGTIGSASGGPMRISGPESLYVTHQLRAQHDAILIGIGTLFADNPRLTVRLAEGSHPQPIIVDTQLRLPLDARIWSHPKPPWIATLETETPAAQALRARGARLLQIPATANRQVDLSALFARLGTEGISSVMVEGGATIISTLIRQQLAHYAVVTIAPHFATGIRLNTPELQPSANLQKVSYTQAGNDILLWGEFPDKFNSQNLILSPATTPAMNGTPSAAV